MRINPDKCVGCGICVIYCPLEAITVHNDIHTIDQEKCLECGVCGRSACPAMAIEESPDAKIWPRSVRKDFSDPTVYHKTKIPGRGTEEVKTNDVTGNVKKGEVGIIVEIGRPCLGASIQDIEKITRRLSSTGVKYEPNNPLINLMQDPLKGIFYDQLKETKIISAIIQFNIPTSKLGRSLEILLLASKEIDTVFSLSLISRLDSNNEVPEDLTEELLKLELSYKPNAKINLGLGKPLKD